VKPLCQHATTSIAPPTVSRRTLLAGGSAVVAALAGARLVHGLTQMRGHVFIAKDQHYDGPLVRTIRDGLLATGFDPRAVRGRRVLLKPNLVEPARQAPHMTTHPAIVAAAGEVFRGWDAEVRVGEGPGHVRDTEMAMVESGLADMLQAVGLPFADLNYEAIDRVPNRGRQSPLNGFYFPRSVLEADLIVSLPKMKTHHWVGVTAAMKNLYGVIPGIKYGWPKNVLHQSGIPETVFDINASLPRTIAIVDGIECMEGDGPIMGTPKSMGLLVMGTNPPAVDATVCRLMEIDPARVSYLRLAANRLGPVADAAIDQRGEAWQPLAQPFELIDQPYLKRLRAGYHEA